MKILHCGIRVGRVLQKYKFSIFYFLYLIVLAFYLRMVFIGWNLLLQTSNLLAYSISLVYAVLNAIIVFSLLNLVSHIRKIGIALVMLLVIFLTIEATLDIVFSSQITLAIFASAAYYREMSKLRDDL